ncbi:MAG: S8 family serine peptidase [Chloroflexi bacterium]|nr:S8 family serine peptidase [Chloroflexota bacterium]
MNAKRAATFGVILVLLLAHALQPFAPLRQAQAAGERESISAALAEQIAKIVKEKRALTGTQKKIDHKIREVAGIARERVAKLRSGENPDLKGLSSRILNINDAGDIQVTLKVKSQTPQQIAQLQSLGMNVRVNLPKFGLVEGSLPYSQVEAVAGLDFVKGVRPPGHAIYHTGNVTSEGDTVLRAAEARSAFGVNGSGLKVGVMSDGVTNLSNSVASGDLPSSPAVNVLKAGSGNEGTALLEIVYDLAPGASLAFYSPSSGADMVAGIQALEAAGANIIIDDITFLDEPKFEDGPIAQEARAFYNRGGVYVTAAGNSAQRHYASMYNPITVNMGGVDYTAHNYSGGDIGNTYTVGNGGSTLAIFQWNDQWGSSGNDLDLYLFRSSDNVILASSTGIQDGTGDPYESLYWQNSTGAAASVYLAVVQYSLVSPPSSIALDYFTYFTPPMQYNVSQDSLIGHQAVSEVLSTGAANVNSPDTIENFSSRGPSTVYWPTYQSRQLPNITGVDRVQTWIGQAGYFSNPFYGTSAAAPHIAAIAALVWSANRSLTQAQVKSAILTTALDRGDSGWDGTWGFGRADAYSAVASVIPPTVTSMNPSSGNAGTTLTGVQISGTNFRSGATVSISGTGVTASNVVVVSSTNITADLTIASNAAAGARNVTVTQGGVSGTGAGLFTVNAFITISAPSPISLGLMAAGGTTLGSSAVPGTVSTNAASWQVVAVDAKSTYKGYMVKAPTTPLGNKFQIGASGASYVAADTPITYVSTTALPLYVKQLVGQNDSGGNYTITITFTGSVP